MSALDAVDEAIRRATAPVADTNDGWETTAAVLAHEVTRLRAQLGTRARTTCPSTTGPGPCLNPIPHQPPRGCVHEASWAADTHDTTEARDD